MPCGRSCPLPQVVPSDWRVRLVTDGSVSKHLNKKSWPSLTSGVIRGVTNTLDGSSGSEKQALWETTVSLTSTTGES